MAHSVVIFKVVRTLCDSSNERTLQMQTHMRQIRKQWNYTTSGVLFLSVCEGWFLIT